MSASSLGITATMASGPEAALVNVSQGGVLLEVTGRLSLGSAVRLKLLKDGTEIAVVNGRVAWQKVASISGGQIQYRIAISFDVPLEAGVFGESGAAHAEPQSAAAPPEEEMEAAPEAEPERGPAVVPFPTAQPKSQPASVPPPTPAATAGDNEDLRRKLAAAKADLSCQSAILESLAGKLRESEQQRTALIRQLADAVRRGDDLQAQVDEREQKHAAALREQQESHQVIVAEMLKTTNDRQGEYHDLLQRLQLAEQEHAEQLRGQEEAHEALVAELLTAANDQQAQYRALFERHELVGSRQREMEARLEAAEALCVMHQDRYRALRRETEKLMKIIDAAAACSVDLEQVKAS